MERGSVRSFEEILVEQCAPTLARLKPASMFRYEPKGMNAEATERALKKLSPLAEILKERGVSIRLLHRCASRDALLILVYRENCLLEILEEKENRAFLEQLGDHPALGLESLLSELSEKLDLAGSFPHEIGLLLGYPLRDVIGFMENGGKNCLATCCWKSYSDPEAAEKAARLYRKCREVYLDCFSSGMPLRRLVVAA